MTTLADINARQRDIDTRLATFMATINSGATLTLAEVQEERDLSAEWQSLEATKRALQADEARRSAASSQPVPRAMPRGIRAAAINTPAAPAVLTHTTQAQRNGDAFPGQTWARINLAKLKSVLAFQRGERIDVPEHLAQLYPSRPEISRIAHFSIRRQAAGVEGGAILSGEAGSELRNLDAQFTGDFIAYLHEQTLFDRMGFRDIPADVRVKGQDGAFTGYWVGEKRAIPASVGSYSSVDLARLKAAGLTYLSRDLIERSAPAAERLFRDGVVKAVAQAVDTKVFGTTDAVANVSPMGLLYNLTGQASAGGTLANLYADLAYLTGIFVGASNTDGEIKFVSNKIVANQIAHLLSPLTGLPAFAGKVTMHGGELDGLPYLTGENFPAANLCAIKVDDVWKIGDSGVSVALSTDATIEADDAPTGEGVTPTAQSANMVSMFQNDMVAIKAVRDINVQYRRPQAIVTARITGSNYNGVEGTA